MKATTFQRMMNLPALVTAANWRAARKCVATCNHPISMLYSYVALPSFDAPIAFEWKTPIGWIKLQAWNPFDVVTQFITFCREQYMAEENIDLVVDFGSNIGISAAYFLSRNAHVRVHMFEPNRDLHKRMEENLACFRGRFEISDMCITGDGRTVTFGSDSSGVFSGIDKFPQRATSRPSLSASTALARIIEDKGDISILKIDIEGAETEVLESLSPHVLARIRRVYAENSPLDASYREVHLDGFRAEHVGGIWCYDRLRTV